MTRVARRVSRASHLVSKYSGDVNALQSLPDRLRRRIVVTTGECWQVQGQMRHGYAKVGTVQASRWVYELLVGPIPDGLQLDHLCHTWDVTCPGGLTCVHRRCVNPRHLEPVTSAENTRRAAFRKVACRRGHPYTADTVEYRGGGRSCRICRTGDFHRRERARGVQPKRRPDHFTHCSNGHEYTPETLRLRTLDSGYVQHSCVICHRAVSQRSKQAKRAS